MATEPQAGTVVSSAALAKHFDCVPFYIRKLVEQGVIERRSDGRFDQDACRPKYFAHLREERQRSPKSAADTEFTAAKAELIWIRIAEKKRVLVLQSDVDELIDSVMGVILPALAGLPAHGVRRVAILRPAATSSAPCPRYAPRCPTSRSGRRTKQASQTIKHLRDSQGIGGGSCRREKLPPHYAVSHSVVGNEIKSKVRAKIGACPKKPERMRRSRQTMTRRDGRPSVLRPVQFPQQPCWQAVEAWV